MTRPEHRWWLDAFPTRRVVAAVVLWPLVFAAFSAAAGPKPSWTAVWLVMLGAASGVAALTLASYLPAPGATSRVEVGCEPCARIAGLSVVASGLLWTMSTVSLTSAVLPLLVVAAGLAQRVRGSRSCPSGR